MVRGDVPGQGSLQLRNLPPETASGEIRQGHRVGLARDHGAQHRATRGPDDVGDHGAQFQVGIFQDFVQPIDHCRALLLQDGAIACQIPQLTEGEGRHEASTEEAALQQLRDPLGVRDIGLPSRHLFHVARIDQHEGDRRLQHVPHRFPQDTGRLDRGVRHARFLEPRGQGPQVVRHRAKRPKVSRDGALRPEQAYARDERLLVHINAAATGNDDVHAWLPFSPGRAGSSDQT